MPNINNVCRTISGAVPFYSPVLLFVFHHRLFVLRQKKVQPLTSEQNNWFSLCIMCVLFPLSTFTLSTNSIVSLWWLNKSSFLCSKFKFDVKLVFPFLRENSKDTTSLCVHCWKWTRFFGSWRLSFPYVALGVALIMWPHNLWLSYVGGVQLIILALLRMFTIFRTDMRGREDSLLPEFDDQSDKWVYAFWR